MGNLVDILKFIVFAFVYLNDWVFDKKLQVLKNKAWPAIVITIFCGKKQNYNP